MKPFAIRNVDGSLDLDRLLLFGCLFVLLIFGIFFTYNGISHVVDSHTFAKSDIRPDADDKVNGNLKIQTVSVGIPTRRRNTVVCMQNDALNFYKDPWGGIASIQAKEKYAVPFGGSKDIQFNFYDLPVNDPSPNASMLHLRMGFYSDSESSAELSLLIFKE